MTAHASRREDAGRARVGLFDSDFDNKGKGRRVLLTGAVGSAWLRTCHCSSRTCFVMYYRYVTVRVLGKRIRCSLRGVHVGAYD